MPRRFLKIPLTLLLLVISLIPLWVFLAVNSFLSPGTFAEKTLLLVLGWIVLAGVQFWALFLGGAAIMALWLNKN